MVIDGRYRIDALHAEGGMSTVFRATHLLLQRRVAFKVVTESLMAVPGCADRFLREARAATRLKNDHIVQVYDVGVLDSGVPYMVMEWLEGNDLAQTIEAGTLPLETAVEYVLQICETLAEVHGRGIIHRDLKPSNLFVTTGPEGTPRIKLLDFGVSKMTAAGDDTRITQTGTILGSPSYMAPEQMGTAEEADERTDVWGVGIVLYEMLVGDVPFTGDSLASILNSIATQGPPAVSAMRQDVPEGVDNVIARCLRPDPPDRYPDVATLAAELAPFGPAGSELRAAGIVALSHAARSRPLELVAQRSANEELLNVIASRKDATPMSARAAQAEQAEAEAHAEAQAAAVSHRAPDETISPCVQSNAHPAQSESAKQPSRRVRAQRSAPPFLAAAMVLLVVGLGVGAGISRLGSQPAAQVEPTVSAPHPSVPSPVTSAPAAATVAPAPSASETSRVADGPAPRVVPARVTRWADLAPLAPSAAPPRHTEELFEERK